ncbi:hypothetical protein ACRYCC_35210 [Actinomadura scrupuli]
MRHATAASDDGDKAAADGLNELVLAVARKLAPPYADDEVEPGT